MSSNSGLSQLRRTVTQFYPNTAATVNIGNRPSRVLVYGALLVWAFLRKQTGDVV